MTTEAMAVVGLPLSVVETQLWDVTQWPTFLAGLAGVRRSSHERYVFSVAQGRKEHDVLVAVRWQARDHRFTWRSLEGPPWDGMIRLVPVNGRRTRVFLQRRSYPRSLLASFAELLGAGAPDPRSDLQRLQDRLAVLPAPARPARLRAVGADERDARTAQIAAQSHADAAPAHPGAVTTHGLPFPRVAEADVVPDLA